MTAIEPLFRSGLAADIILAVMLAELLALVRAGRSPVHAALALAPGALIVLALRGALTDAPVWQVAVPLALSLPLHLADLGRRGWLVGRTRAARRPLGSS